MSTAPHEDTIRTAIERTLESESATEDEKKSATSLKKHLVTSRVADPKRPDSSKETLPAPSAHPTNTTTEGPKGTEVSAPVEKNPLVVDEHGISGKVPIKGVTIVFNVPPKGH